MGAQHRLRPHPRAQFRLTSLRDLDCEEKVLETTLGRGGFQLPGNQGFAGWLKELMLLAICHPVCHPLAAGDIAGHSRQSPRATCPSVCLSSQVLKVHPCSTFTNKPCEMYAKWVHFSHLHWSCPIFASLRHFAFAVPSAWNPFSPHLIGVSSSSFRSQLKCHLLGEVVPGHLI